ncbi:uncharacterized protein EI90DRAFT_2276849 [Cantharellus anzutake]|uniref:uncharacterized protein n=1 Tax=Cantharellus anzutake TaxID=1750568 RepID=UPI001907737A|nr:uncharacterized protein EI90DRAFT_2276849 [Cantharellus anzutake]KAF8339732.1 hypothetical protein EI90DRAFT_2276849 [Cantharellus anzutake]
MQERGCMSRRQANPSFFFSPLPFWDDERDSGNANGDLRKPRRDWPEDCGFKSHRHPNPSFFFSSPLPFGLVRCNSGSANGSLHKSMGRPEECRFKSCHHPNTLPIHLSLHYLLVTRRDSGSANDSPICRQKVDCKECRFKSCRHPNTFISLHYPFYQRPICRMPLFNKHEQDATNTHRLSLPLEHSPAYRDINP